MHEFTDIFIAVDTDLIKSYLVSGSINVSLLKSYNQEEVFFFLDIINSSKGCPYCIHSKVCEIVPLSSTGYFNMIGGEDVEQYMRRLIVNLQIIYDAKFTRMPEDLRLEFKRALDLLKEAHKISLVLKDIATWNFALWAVIILTSPLLSDPFEKVLRFLGEIFSWGRF